METRAHRINFDDLFTFIFNQLTEFTAAASGHLRFFSKTREWIIDVTRHTELGKCRTTMDCGNIYRTYAIFIVLLEQI